MTTKKPLTPRQKQLLGLLVDRPDCVPMAELAAAVGLRKGRTAEVLRELRDLGRAAVTNHGRWARWGLPDAVRALNRLAAEQRAAPAPRQRPPERDDELVRRPIVHLRTAAGQAEPMRGLGPASVFHLATA